MLEKNIREIRYNISAILEKVEKGTEVLITRRGKPVARLSAIENSVTKLKSLNDFRKSVAPVKKKVYQTINTNREVGN